MNKPEIKKGLAGVVVDETTISKVMPETNSLTYRGYAVQELCDQTSFMEVAYLLIQGELPNKPQLNEFKEREKKYRQLDENTIKLIHLTPLNCHPMDALRTVISYLALTQNNLQDRSPENIFTHTLNLLAKIPTILAYLIRKKKKLEFIQPRANLDFNENFFNMCFGQIPSATTLKAFDVSMILYAEHSFNASTFTTRIITSSLSDFYGAICGGIASLKGPLHGGANEAVMEMLLEIGKESKTEEWVRNKLVSKEVIMGFGHRVYKSGDSRVPTMKYYFHKIAEELNEKNWVNISNKIEKIIVKEKNIHPNLDFPAGPAYHLMGFEIEFFTPLFVMSRITGWSSHIMEQNQNNRLIRPLSSYKGSAQRNIKPLNER